MKRFIIVFIIFNMIYCADAQEGIYDINFLDFVQNACKNVDLDKFSLKTEDTLVIGKFDFKNFNIINNTIDNNQSFVLYKEQENLKKISKKDIKNMYQNFDIFIEKSEYSNIGFIWNHDTDKDFKGYFVNGLILNNKLTSETFFIYIKDLIIEKYVVKEEYKSKVPPSPRDVNREFNMKSRIDAEDILFILKLDENLNPQTRLNFYDGKLLSFSEVIEAPEYKEQLYFYSTENSETIEELTINNLKFILERGSSKGNGLISCTVYPDYIKGAPFWLQLSRKYK